MTQQETQALYAALLRLVDDGQVLTPLERRDILNQIIRARCDQTMEDILAATANKRKLQIKRGTTAENDAYTGLIGEITMDTETNTLRVHDGLTVGGITMARADSVSTGPGVGGDGVDPIVAYQLPDADNSYTWYRKFESGWIDQGGNNKFEAQIMFPVEMADNNYSVQIVSTQPIGGSGVWIETRTSTYMLCRGQNYSGAIIPAGCILSWRISGMAKSEE